VAAPALGKDNTALLRCGHFKWGYVCFGSKADIAMVLADVRFTLKVDMGNTILMSALCHNRKSTAK
jgi:hypothetical protein